MNLLKTNTYRILDWVKPIEKAVLNELFLSQNKDGSHDIGHFQRVSSLSCRFAKEENGNELVAFTAGMLHDIVNLPKDHPLAKTASFLASEKAFTLLNELNFPAELIPNVCHAIQAHSFSAKIEPETIEARCVQDADRMEALGAFGLMRVFYVSGSLNAEILNEDSPATSSDDKKYALDHFNIKLFKLEETMKTAAGKNTAKELTQFLKDFWEDIIQDHADKKRNSARFQIAKIYQNAGINRLALFDLEDPFGISGRTLDPLKYALDALLPMDDPYIQKFMSQLKFELNGYD